MRKSYRVKKEKEFQRVFHQGESIANRQFVVYRYHQPEQKHFRVGISVSKKLGNAVTRNHLKRYIRQSLTDLKPNINPEYDMVIIARKPIVKMSYHEVKKSLVHVLKLATLLPKEFELESRTSYENEKTY
ncbi:ribonuclease P protein component [Granulicatella balaenopterae]|uniref:Ribonuclease P protein component n=1 Tax=Granulicatella balaenopterae TaxID=137733 RepID=A0A1H9ND04_9LACT|nr:ribonuclease P protein component [Granulicatella balaenopterae]SER33243.1 ribonuclease P protein component [Granulicatella balaenopterae]